MWAYTDHAEVAPIRCKYAVDPPPFSERGHRAINESKLEILEFGVELQCANEIGGKRQFILVASRWVEDLGDQLAHGHPLLPQKVVNFSEHQSGHDDQARRGENVFIFREARSATGAARKRSKEPARVRDDWSRQFSMSRNNSDSSPSFVSVDSKSRVEGGRRPL